MSTFEERLRSALSPAYTIERELTGAGMSRVFVAMDVALGRRIVVKVLPPELTAGVNRDRFRREIQVAAQLHHPHIVTLLSAGEDGDLLYYTMPFIEGESLRIALEKGPLSVKEVVRVLHDVVDALSYAHARGVIHRDIKPGNILKLGSHAMVTDFGVAKALNAAMPVSGITTSGMVIGTPAYMAPEQLAGDPAADHRIDIYAVGLLAYELLTGESPFTGPSPQATMAAQLTRVPEPLYLCCPDVPPPLSAIIMQCLAKAPEMRPPTAEALMAALDSITTSSGEIRSGTAGAVTPGGSSRRRIAAAAGVAAVVLGSAVVMFASQKNRGVRESGILADGPATEAGASSMDSVTKARSAVPPSVAQSVAAATATPIVLTLADSMAIAQAVRKRLAQEEASKGTRHLAVITDSLTAYVTKIAIDSIMRASFPRATPFPAGQPFTFNPGRNGEAWTGKRRLVITDPRPSSRSELNTFGKALTDSLRAAFAKRSGYSVVDGDSVRAVLSRSRSRQEVEAALKPDLMISSGFAGTGDTMVVILTMRDVRGDLGFGARTSTARFAVSDAASVISRIVGSAGGQFDEMARSRRFMRVGRPPTTPTRGSER